MSLLIFSNIFFYMALSSSVVGKQVMLFPCSLSECPPKVHQPCNFTRKSPWQRAEGRNSNLTPPSRNKLPVPQKQDLETPEANSSSPRGSSPSPKPHRRAGLSCHSSASDLGSPDVIIEEVLDREQEHGVCGFVTCPCLTLISSKSN